MKVKGTLSWCMLEEYVNDKKYERFHTHSYHCCSKMHLSSRLSFDKVSIAKTVGQRQRFMVQRHDRHAQ